MEPIKELYTFQNALMQWYKQEAKVLPWRSNPTPYNVWISEIMLQQTRVETVIPYFVEFVKELPTVQDLACVEEERLLKLWQGLGYYRRALHLKKAASEIVAKFNGKIPSTIDDLLSLPGIGPYTAGAIASIAYGQKTPAVDGNVLRIFARISNSEENISELGVRKKIQLFVESLLPLENPGDFNQALMDLGAQICIPNGEPKCSICPINIMCQAHLKGNPSTLPIKTPKKQRKIERKTVFIIQHENRFALRKRKHGLLANLWEFPNEEEHLTHVECIRAIEKFKMIPVEVVDLLPAKHIFTHIEWHMIGYFTCVSDVFEAGDFTWVTMKEIIEQYAIPSLCQSLLFFS